MSIADGSYWETPKEEVSLNEFYQNWIESKSRNLKAGTLADYKSTFRLHVLPSLGDKQLANIKPKDIQACIDSVKGKPATANKTYRYLRNLLNNAVDTDVIERSPCRGIIVPSAKRETEFDILSLKEVRQVCEVADESMATLIAVLAYSGLRIGEALGLKWKDVDFDGRCIRVERTWTKHNAWSTPKSRKSRRAVPMTLVLAEILAGAYDKAGRPSPETVIFSGDGKRPFDHSNVRRKFNKVLTKAGVRHVRIHDCRHTYSTNMLACGCSIKALQYALGHSTATLTLDTYSHYIPESAAEAIARFDALLSGSVSSLSDQKKG